MLCLIVVVIMMGFPTAFTLMGLGMMFGFVAFYEPGASFLSNKIFTLMVQRTFGAMNNDVLLSIPLFVLMGYIMERGALVDKMFHSVQLAFRNLPGSLAITTLVICTFWGIASGLVGAVVVLMGVIALRPMLNAGYDTRLAAGVITAGGTLGILIPPSVMIIVYAAVAGQSVVKLYAAAMFPGFFLAFLYLVYVIGWCLINPKIAPKLPPEQMKAPISPWIASVSQNYSRFMLPALAMALFSPSKAGVPFYQVLRGLLRSLVPALIAVSCLGATWWYVTIHSQSDNNAAKAAVSTKAADDAKPAAPTLAGFNATAKEVVSGGVQEPPGAESMTTKVSGGVQDPPSEDAVKEPAGADEALQQMGVGENTEETKTEAVPAGFYTGFWIACGVVFLLLLWYYKNFNDEQYEILTMLISSVMPLMLLTLMVLGVILFGLTTATESAAVGAAGAFLMAWQAKSLDFQKIKEAVFLTAKTTSMVCWLFVGSALFSAVFALLGGQTLIEQWVLGMDLTPIQFMLVSQAIIFVLGWPLEWTEIIVIFVPIFLPLLPHFGIDPMLWGVLVFVNLQAAFLSPPVAMSAFYLKGVAPSHVTINQIFAGMMPYMLIVIVCMIFMYIWPGLTLWLPKYLYGG
jgi:TRAP-type mannitol/chloroaromatic compound transport system permease large subunit